MSEGKVNAYYKYPRAYIYLMSSNYGGEDYSDFEFGVVRVGVSGNHVTKYPIKKHEYIENLNFKFISKDNMINIVNNSDSDLFFMIIG